MAKKTYSAWDPASGTSVEDFLYSEIAAQQMAGLGSWSGGLDPQTSMRAMAEDLAKSGVTSLGQLGWDPKAEKYDWHSFAYENQGIGMDNVGAISNPGIAEDDPVYGKYGAMINTDTGKALYSRYGQGRTKGKSWSGSYAGKGNTGFDLEFDADGNPIFGTHGESSVTGTEALIGIGGGLAMFAAPFLAGTLGAGAGGAEAAYAGPMSLGWDGAGATGAGAAGSAGAAYTGPMSLGWDGVGATGAGTAGTAATTAQEAFRASELAQQAAGAGALPAAVAAPSTAAAGSNPLSSLASTAAGGTGSLLKTLLPILAAGSSAAGGTSGINDLVQALLANKGSQESADYALQHAEELRALGAEGIKKSTPWDTSGGRATADAQLQKVIRGDFNGDAGYNLAQNSAARASSQQPGGMAAQSAALAALKYQNDRINALSSPAGVQFDPSTGYRNAIAANIAANDLGGQGLASKGFGNRTANSAIGDTAVSFVDQLLKSWASSGSGGGTSAPSLPAASGSTYTGPMSTNWDGTGATSYDDALFGDFGW